jgi:spore photoproduct lyase
MKIQNIYVEERVKEHSKTKKILGKIKFENIIYCKSYTEILNPTNQNFRIQKMNPSLILAKKENNFIFKTPKRFTIGFYKNYYFSHMLNCVYDCKYCYLQGMLNSANYLIFVNYEDFYLSIKKKIKELSEPICFFSGYDCDSLALEHITNFLEEFLPHFKNLRNGYLEIRSKSVNTSVLKKREPLTNVIPAFSLNPQLVIENFEDRTPNLETRLKAIKNLQEKGWNIGIRFDPLIFYGSKKNYINFFEEVFAFLDIKKIHSVTLGNFRMPKNYLKKMAKIRPEDKLVQQNYVNLLFKKENKYSNHMVFFCYQQILKFIQKRKVFIN